MVCLVYDTKNQDSLDHMKFWYEKTLESFHHDRNIIGCIMANKSERNEYSSGLVNDATVKKISETFKMKHFECSAVKIELCYQKKVLKIKSEFLFNFRKRTRT